VFADDQAAVDIAGILLQLLVGNPMRGEARLLEGGQERRHGPAGNEVWRRHSGDNHGHRKLGEVSLGVGQGEIEQISGVLPGLKSGIGGEAEAVQGPVIGTGALVDDQHDHRPAWNRRRAAGIEFCSGASAAVLENEGRRAPGTEDQLEWDTVLDAEVGWPGKSMGWIIVVGY
jgi:hypothetical protein